MKKVALFSIVLFLSFAAKAQTVKQVEDSMMYYLGNIGRWSASADRPKNDNFDSLDSYNIDLQHYIKIEMSKRSATLTADFARAIKKGMTIATSDDHKFRIYSWDEESGGTMHIFRAILQYKMADGHTYCRLICPKQEGVLDISDKGDGPGYFYPNIYTIHAKNKVYYLAIRKAIYSSKDCSTGIQAFAIQDGMVNDSIAVFKTKTELLNSIDCGYDWDGDFNAIKLSPDKKKLYIPLVDGEIKTNKYLVYKFDGNQFIFDKNAK